MNIVMKVVTLPFISIEKIIKFFSLKNANDFRKIDEVQAFQEQARQIRLLNTPFL